MEKLKLNGTLTVIFQTRGGIVQLIWITQEDPRIAMWYLFSGEKGWRSGESARLPPVCPGFDSRTRRYMWDEFVVGSLLCSERFFSGYSGFPLSSKTNISKFQF